MNEGRTWVRSFLTLSLGLAAALGLFLQTAAAAQPKKAERQDQPAKADQAQKAKVKVPNVVGMAEADARKALGATGLTMVNSPKQQSTKDPALKNKVASQSPAAGAMVDSGGRVTITRYFHDAGNAPAGETGQKGKGKGKGKKNQE